MVMRTKSDALTLETGTADTWPGRRGACVVEYVYPRCGCAASADRGNRLVNIWLDGAADTTRVAYVTV